jgi:DNA-binding transcriptional LysR family regulator
MVDLNDAALLVRVVRTRSFSAAARERGVPVSTVSRRISRLEAALGARLLQRTTRALQLTDAGRAYFEHAERAMDELAQGAGDIRERQSEPSGRVRIVAPTTLGSAAARVICTYLAAHPRVSVDLELDRRPMDLVTKGFDIAIVTDTIEETSDFVARELWRKTRKLLFASPSYVKAHGAPSRVADLARHACVATRAADGFATWTLVQGRSKRRVTFAPRFYVSEFTAALRAVLHGVGIALLPEVLCADDVANRRLVRVLDEWQGESGGVQLLYRAHHSLGVAVRSCVEHLLAELPGTDPSGARTERSRAKMRRPA